MTDILLLMVLVLLAPVSVLSVRLLRHEKTAAEVDKAARESAEAGRRMDEGFDNLMTYSVNLGHGRMSGGEP